MSPSKGDPCTDCDYDSAGSVVEDIQIIPGNHTGGQSVCRDPSQTQEILNGSVSTCLGYPGECWRQLPKSQHLAQALQTLQIKGITVATQLRLIVGPFTCKWPKTSCEEAGKSL